MFSGRHPTSPSSDGSYFIDRDPTHFRRILNYLRTGAIAVPEDEHEKAELLCEADFYALEALAAPRCRLLTDDAARALAAGCGALTRLDLARCDGVGEPGARACRVHRPR